MEYILSDKTEGCFLCDAAETDDDGSAYVLAREGPCLAVLNAYPYNPGHLMVAPLRHVGALEELSDEELIGCQRLLQRGVRALTKASGPEGFNAGMNLGRVAGAGVPDHLHWHLVPRWNGDTNYMPVLSETRVLPELLSETYRRLKDAF